MEFPGWFGAVTVLAGYLHFSMGKLPNGPVYQLFNLVGGLAVAINVAAHHAVPSTIVNGIWAIVAVVVLVKMAKARRAAKRGAPSTETPLLHAEPPATTAVLPIVGPALRDHGAEATLALAPEPRLQGPDADGDATTTPDAMHTTDATHATSTPDATSTTDAPTAAAPMTESIPVITATIALALVAAAQEHADQATHADPTHADQQTHTDEPQRADATPA
ncbi:hypothetical protein J2X60_000792 [Curtobacterium sp. 320]|uniref:CBU_0592 family membrane protein n=1 Tax=Curtobacterium sp. 320 TaxID=2817749 RepID=UPI002865FE9E|nr:hypothetical protein [Curtobacterium sp. 320]MDR6572156.1 hypothetical protein [Curtobacterium sp. 320]